MKKNENCLAGMRCPNCGSADTLKIEVTQTKMVVFHDDGSDDNSGGDMEWDNKSACECGKCGHSGTVADFGRNLDNDNFVADVLAYHDLSEEFWDSLKLNQQQELANEMVRQKAAEPSLKYYVGKIIELNGEREYTERICFSASTDPEAVLDAVASTWCGKPDNDDEDYRNGGYYFNCGCFFVKASGFQEVSKKEFDILGRFITVPQR